MLTCDRCGASITEEDPGALAWTTSVERGRMLRFCVACSRENIRAIEGKLDSGWW